MGWRAARWIFAGTAKMQATVSAMVGGWKGLLLKPVDRYFEKDGAGTEVPIHINGTRENPQFGVEFNRMKLTSPQRSGEGDKVPEESTRAVMGRAAAPAW